MKNWNIFKAETTFDFGRNKGKTLEQVAQSDAPYILWCVNNIEKFLISVEDLTSYQKKYPIVFSNFDEKTGEYIGVKLNKFYLQETDIKSLELKWESYDEYIEMLSNDDCDYFDDFSVGNNPYYNDNLDMDQQDQEFWDSF